MSEVYLSSGAFQTRSLAAIVAECLDAGLTHLELSSGVAHDNHLLAPVRAAKGRLTFLVHNYFPTPARPFVLNLAASDGECLAASLALCQEAIDLAAELRAPFYSVHSGFAVTLRPEVLGRPDAQAAIPESAYVPRDQALDTFARSVRALARYGTERGVRLLIENNVIAPRFYRARGSNPLLMCDAGEIRAFFAELSEPNLGLLLDVGHAKVSGSALGFDPVAFVREVAPHVEAFHLSDNDGIEDQNRPFEASSWFAPLLQEFPDAAIVIEAYGLNVATRREQSALACGLQSRCGRVEDMRL